MVKINYANAYKEVLVIIKNLIKEDYDKIPKEYIEFLTENCNNDHEFYYDNTKTFEEQEILEDTKYILFGLFEKFGATEEQKEKIKKYKNNYYKKIEEEKRKLYDTENIFKKDTSIKSEEQFITNEIDNKLMVIPKENIFQKIINKIKSLFKK